MSEATAAARAEARERLLQATMAVSLCAETLRPFAPLFAQFRREKAFMESAGAVAEPMLFRNRTTAALLGPIFAEAEQFLSVLDEQNRRTRDALRLADGAQSLKNAGNER